MTNEQLKSAENRLHSFVGKKMNIPDDVKKQLRRAVSETINDAIERNNLKLVQQQYQLQNDETVVINI